jgi:hypothetical protein
MTQRIGRKVAGLLLLPIVCLVGCGQDGPQRYRLSGAVTFQGKPVPEGNIAFEPVEGEVGGGYAFISQGKYDTAAAGRGHLGGPHRVRIVGYTGELVDPSNPDSGSPPLFDAYETTMELPAESTTIDFQVPAD